MHEFGFIVHYNAAVSVLLVNSFAIAWSLLYLIVVLVDVCFAKRLMCRSLCLWTPAVATYYLLLCP